MESVLNPGDFGLQKINPEDIYGGESIEEAAQIFINVLQGKGSPAQQAVVCANAAVAIATSTGCSLETGFEKATRSLENRSAHNSFKKLQAISA